MGDVKLTWNGTDIVDISATGSKTLKTGGKYNPYDIGLVYTKPAAPTPVLQTKSATPSLSAQQITADNGYDGLAEVDISAVDSTLLASLDADFVAGNIKKDVDLFGLTGTFEGGGGALKMGVIRPDAELVQSYSYNKLIVTEDSITLPSYPSSSVTIKSSENLTPTVTLDMDTYKYFVLIRGLVIPVYNTSTPAKGRQEYYLGSVGYELSEIPPNTLIAASGTKYANRITDICTITAVQKLLAWTNTTSLQVNNGTAYGAAFAFVTPSISTNVLTLKSPTFQIRATTNYLPSGVYSTITDIRYQWIIDVYRVAKTSLNIEGWTQNSQVKHIISCWDNGGTLT